MNKSATRGFSLIEVLVTIVVMLAGIAAYAASVYSIAVIKDAREQALATHIAENEIENLRQSGYSNLPGSGSFADSQLSSLPSGSGSLTVSAFDAKTKQVDVSVSWTEPNIGARSVSLTTLVTQTGGLK